MNGSTRNRLIIILALAGLALSACAGGAAPESKDEVEAGASQINPHPVEDLQPGGTLRAAIPQIPQQWNFYQVDGTLAVTSSILGATFPQVFRFNERNEPELDRNYVTDARLETGDTQRVTYRINERAAWSDGTPITWRDFEAVWRGNSGADPAYLSGNITGYSSISSVTAGADDREVVVTFSTPFADWKKLFVVLYPAQYYSSSADFNTGWLEKIPVSAGPFRLSIENISQTAQTVTLVPDPGWWGEKPVLDSVVLRSLEGNADIDAYLNNELDVVLTSSGTRFGRVKDAPSSEIRVASGSAFSHITFGSGGLLADTDTRRALQAAIDRRALAASIYSSLPYRVEPLNNHFYLNTDRGYTDNAPAGEPDPQRAAEALDHAGWKVSGDARVKDGVTLAPRLVIPAATPTSQQLAELVQAQLAAVQVKVEIVTVPSEAFFRDNVTPGNFDLTIFSWASTGFLADSVSIYQAGDKTQNYGKISTEKITDLLTQANAELDPKKLADLTNQADRLVWEEGHSLPIAQTPRVVAIRPGIANYGAFAGNFGPDWTTVGWLK
ncbi:ABC transporter family substrate-binding protein [Mycetocola spongiae]|uniref:ABC transporter family substrate-binding protein n=1 Tax=Mycetocola spongiae TaxID=2859226 RepID=UPI001CF409C0|nr:ABC transporter family substrate-binding protein [Mycetocola spongiae]UCR89441.1 ABC transporter family substrate-binding protein [Mycetocola spongiae]